MKSFSLYGIAPHFIDAIIILLCANGIFQVVHKPGFQFTVNADNKIEYVDANTRNNFLNGFRLESIDGKYLNHREQIEFYLDGKRIGDKVKITASEPGGSKIFYTELTNYYGYSEIALYIFVGGIFLFLAVFVKVKSSEKNPSVRMFYYASAGLAMVITMTAGSYSTFPVFPGIINRILWFFAYALTPVMFIHFTYLFGFRIKTGNNFLIKVNYTFALLIALILSITFIIYVYTREIYYLILHTDIFNSYFRIFTIIAVLTAVTVCVYAYKSAERL